MLSRCFTKIYSLVPYSSEYFEPVRGGYFTAQGFVGIYKKTCSDLGGQQVMCFRKWVGLVGSCFWGDRKLLFRKTDRLGWECKNFGFLHTKTVWINLKIFIRSHHFLCHTKPWFCTKLSTQPTPTSHFHRTQYNVQFLFLTTTCGGKPALQLWFPTKSDSAFVA